MKIKTILISVFLSLFFLPSYANTPQHRFSVSIGGGYMMPFVSPNMMNYGGNASNTITGLYFNSYHPKEAVLINKFQGVPVFTKGNIYSNTDIQYHFNRTFSVGISGMYIPHMAKASTNSYSVYYWNFKGLRKEMDLHSSTSVNSWFYGVEPMLAYTYKRVQLSFGIGYGHLDNGYDKSKGTATFYDYFKDIPKDTSLKSFDEYKKIAYDLIPPSALDLYKNNQNGLLISLGVTGKVYSLWLFDFNVFIKQDVFLGTQDMIGAYVDGNMYDIKDVSNHIHTYNAGKPMISLTTIGLNLGFNFG